MWAKARLLCLNKLGKWHELAAAVLDDVDEDPWKAWNEDKRDPCLALFIRSHLKLKEGRQFEQEFVSWSPRNPNPLFAFLERSQLDEGKRCVLINMLLICH
jgi:hypothetical protein